MKIYENQYFQEFLILFIRTIKTKTKVGKLIVVEVCPSSLCSSDNIMVIGDIYINCKVNWMNTYYKVYDKWVPFSTKFYD